MPCLLRAPFHCPGDSKKRWLTYNMLGGISSREDDDFCAVEVSFHDAAQHRRVPLLTDFYHFSMASLSTAVTFLLPSQAHVQLTCEESAK